MFVAEEGEYGLDHIDRWYMRIIHVCSYRSKTFQHFIQKK